MLMLRDNVRGVKVGADFGRLRVLGSAFRIGRNWFAVCVCKCGEVRVVETAKLESGHSKACRACGLNIARVYRESGVAPAKHGDAKDGKKSLLYHIWRELKARCKNSKHKSYGRYGGRGIRVCDEWSSSYVAFREWAMNSGYQEGLSIDRVDNDGGYEPSNCQWMTRGENSRKAHLNIKHQTGAKHYSLAAGA